MSRAVLVLFLTRKTAISTLLIWQLTVPQQNVRDIQGRTHLSLARQQLALSGLTLSGGPLTLLAELTLAEGTANGALYAQLGQLGMGIELIDREPTLKVLQPRRWFEQWRQTRQAAQSLSC